MSRPQDIGGQKAGPIPRADHETAPWAKQQVAIVSVLRGPGHEAVRLDELRRCAEGLGERYHALGYFERATEALMILLDEKGILGRDEVAARMKAIRRRARTEESE